MSSQKHEMLFSRFGINYNDLPARFRKGSILVREEVRACDHLVLAGSLTSYQVTTGAEGVDRTEAAPVVENVEPPTPPQLTSRKTKVRTRTTVELYHCDIIGDEFWNSRPSILAD